MAGDQRHIHDPEKAAEFAHALGLMVGGHHPFVGDWQVKGLYAYRYGKYKGQAYFGTGGSESDRLRDTHNPSKPGESNQKYRPWNRDDPKIPEDIRHKLIRWEDKNSIRVVSRGITEDSRVVTPLRTGWYRIEHADGSLIERVRVHRDDQKTSATNEFIATGDFTGDVTWYVESNTVKVPKFDSTGTIQADGNITWARDGNKAVYEGNAGDPSTGEQSIRNDVGKIALKSVHGKYLSAQPDGRAEWNRPTACAWEFFELGERDGRKVTLRSTHGKYVSAQPDGTVQINRDHAPPGGWEEFTVETRHGPTPGDAHDFLHLKSVHGKYLSAQADGTVQWNRDYAPPGGWEDIQFVPQGTQNQDLAPSKQEESIEILEAVTGKPIRFKLNSPPIHNDAWVGIYPPNAIDQDHGAQNNRWKWLRDIDASNASFSRGAAGPRSIRVFSDGGYTLHARKDFVVETAEKPRRGRIGFPALFCIFLMLPGLPLLIVGSISTAEDRLAMLIPGAVLMSVGGFALLSSIAAVISGGSTEDRSSVMLYQEAVDGAFTKIEVLSFNHRQPIRFKIINPPNDKKSWVGIYPSGADDKDHGGRWIWVKDMDINNASFPGQEKGAWSIRVFSNGRYKLHQQVEFEVEADDKNEVWMHDARHEDGRLIGQVHYGSNNQFTKEITTDRIQSHRLVGNVNRFETQNTIYLVYEHELRNELNDDLFWKI
ncbi:MAG: hypothetical protein VXW14_02855 [Candidatus Thermoplasmatota archaeon]|nr:hypothetical protein [Candidatus Thermoplasmatota archaeon]